MRFIGKILVFLFSLVHWLLTLVVGAHVNVLRNLFSRHPDADRPHQVSRRR
jgi:hypothetical protein